MKYALYPGCTVLGRGRNYEMSAREIARIFDVELIYLDDFECCGFPVKSLHHEAFLLMAARNILAAEQRDLDICTLCSACTGSLTEVNKYLNEHFEEKARVAAMLKKHGMDYRMGRAIKIKHFTKVLYEDIGPEEIGKKVKRKLPHMRFAAHYGCHYMRPSYIYEHPEDPENPHSLDDLIRVTGAESIDYSEKMKCCGAGVLAIDEDLAYSIARPKLREISNDHADAMVLMCPFCSVMFDDNQKKMEQKSQEQYGLPVLYYPQLLGIALDLSEKALGLKMNRVSTKTLLEKMKTTNQHDP